MLSNADDYYFLNLSGLEHYIKGDTYPLRKARGDGSHRVLKYEDLLYLNEEKLRRWNYGAGFGSTAVTPPRRNLQKSNFSDSVNYDVVSWGDDKAFLDPSIKLEGNTFPLVNVDGYRDNYHMPPTYNSLRIITDHFIPLTSVTAINPTFLDEECIDSAYDNITGLTRTIRRCNYLTDSSVAVTYYNGSVYVDRSSDVTDNRFVPKKYIFYRGLSRYGYEDGRFVAELHPVEYDFTYANTQFKGYFVKSAFFVFLITLGITLYNSNNPNDSICKTVTLNASVTSSEGEEFVSIISPLDTGFSLVREAATMCDDYGITESYLLNNGWGYEVGRHPPSVIGYMESFLIIDHDFDQKRA